MDPAAERSPEDAAPGDQSRFASAPYQLFMLVLCLYALGVLAFQTAVAESPETRTILDYADYVVCLLFFGDFVVSLLRAPDRWRYFYTWGWLDLLSSIPMVDAVRWGRAARVLRVLRVLRGLRATKLLATLILRRRAESSFVAASLVALLLLVFCSVAVLHFEDDPASNIKTAEDALWWAYVTITTVGYGDRFPVTSEGRFIGAILMAAGVGLFGVFSGFLAAWFLGAQGAPAPPPPDEGSELRALREEIAALREAVGRLEGALAARPTTDGPSSPAP
jgi:voltage-gated potassium channel